MSVPVTVKVSQLTRLRNSTMGNPKWRIKDTFGNVFTTATDAMVGYLVSDYLIGKEVTMTFDKSNNVIGLEIGGS